MVINTGHRSLLDNGRRGIKAWNKAETDGRGSQIDLGEINVCIHIIYIIIIYYSCPLS